MRSGWCRLRGGLEESLGGSPVPLGERGRRREGALGVGLGCRGQRHRGRCGAHGGGLTDPWRAHRERPSSIVPCVDLERLAVLVQTHARDEADLAGGADVDLPVARDHLASELIGAGQDELAAHPQRRLAARAQGDADRARPRDVHVDHDVAHARHRAGRGRDQSRTRARAPPRA